MFVIGHDQGFGIGCRIQDACGEAEQAWGDLGDGHGGGGEQETERLMHFGIEAEEGGRNLVGADGGVIAITRHLAFAGAGQAVRIDGEQATLEVAPGATQATQGELQFFGVGNGMGVEQLVNTLIGSHKGQAIEEFEALLTEGAGGTEVHHPEGGFMGQLQGQAGGEIGGRGIRPAAEQIPSSQAQVFRGQQPEADQIAGNLIGQQLADAALDGEVIEPFAPVSAEGSEGFHFHPGTLRMELIEFFFAARTEQ